MDAKNKSNIKLLSIVASVVLLIIVLGASFAYFGTYKEDIDKYKINITIDQFAKATFVTKDANLNLSVSKKDMVAYEAGTKAAENSDNLNVVLTSGNPNVKVTCTYDIYYEYDTNSSIYGVSPTPVTDSSLKELTLKAVGSTGTNNYADEKNFNYDTNWTQNPYKRLIVKGASITDATKNGTTDTWKFNMAFYNLDADQNKLAGKTFAGSFYVDKDSIQCDYQNNESNPTLYQTIENRYNQDKTYLGLYDGEGADTYANPVYYYKGNVQNNNVLFGGFCWKIVRTTETGGVKIVYNGVQKDGSCNNTGTDSQIGTSAFNTSYNSPAYVGYMYNTVYPTSYKSIIDDYITNINMVYGDGATYASNKYTLTNATKLSSISDIGTLVGKYTCNSSSTTETCSNLWYIVGYSGDRIYYYSLSGGDLDGTNKGQNYVFGSSFTYANGTYTLNDTTTINSDNWDSQKQNVNTHHYTCLSSETTCSSIYYVYFIFYGSLDYITLTGGKSVNDALNEMLYADDVNTKDSTIKAYIDSWYENNLISYEYRLEDTVFCNDRGILNLNGWNPKIGDTTSYLYFKNRDTSNQSLACANETDRFSHGNTKAYLKYPIGLLSVPELSLASYGSSHYFNNGEYAWLASPNHFSSIYLASVARAYSGGFSNNTVASSRGVRPSVSLKPGTEFKSGDGSYTSPFVID